MPEKDSSEVIYISGMASLLGKTEASIRDGMRRSAEWLPKGFKIAGRHAWLRSDVLKFLRELRDGGHQKQKPGRKRQPAPTLRTINQPSLSASSVGLR
ncbi:hypothetical protein LX59_03014 [Azomonas agilis]|uniref:Uncharacterized protein n=1 Tax=Azomonas agilis TaxID=116849 RepID=A0A562HYK5_9GAMM|nr:hypothetical protein LX59_03014 [Azomonas agilis]